MEDISTFYHNIPLIDPGGAGLGTTDQHELAAPKISPLNGRIVVATMNASSLGMESSVLGPMISAGVANKQLNKNIVFINLAISAKDLNDWISGVCWPATSATLAAAGLTYADVQVFITKEEDLRNHNTDPSRVDQVYPLYVQFLQLMKTKFPNVKQTFIMGRSYVPPTGDSSALNEPNGWMNGFVTREIVMNQINGNPDCSIQKIGWVSDGMYLWTNYTAVRSDGYFRTADSWNPPHPSPVGQQQVSTYIYNWLFNNSNFFAAGVSDETDYGDTTATAAAASADSANAQSSSNYLFPIAIGVGLLFLLFSD